MLLALVIFALIFKVSGVVVASTEVTVEAQAAVDVSATVDATDASHETLKKSDSQLISISLMKTETTEVVEEVAAPEVSVEVESAPAEDALVKRTSQLIAVSVAKTEAVSEEIAAPEVAVEVEAVPEVPKEDVSLKRSSQRISISLSKTEAVVEEIDAPAVEISVESTPVIDVTADVEAAADLEIAPKRSSQLVSVTLEKTE